MIICVCKAVRERDIDHAIQAGACSMAEIRQCLGVGTQCGKCGKFAKDYVKEKIDLVELDNGSMSMGVAMA